MGKRRRQCGAVGAPTRDVIVRPWLETPRSPCSRGGSAGSVSDDHDDYDDDEEEIEVEEKKPPANQSVSPLDALLQMATKTFDGLKSHEAQPTGEHLNTCHKMSSYVYSCAHLYTIVCVMCIQFHVLSNMFQDFSLGIE